MTRRSAVRVAPGWAAMGRAKGWAATGWGVASPACRTRRVLGYPAPVALPMPRRCHRRARQSGVAGLRTGQHPIRRHGCARPPHRQVSRPAGPVTGVPICRRLRPARRDRRVVGPVPPANCGSPHDLASALSFGGSRRPVPPARHHRGAWLPNPCAAPHGFETVPLSHRWVPLRAGTPRCHESACARPPPAPVSRRRVRTWRNW